MPTTEPVIVPVELDISRAQTALGALGNQVQTARGALGGAAGPAAGPGASAPVGAQPVSLGGLMREMQALESSVGRLVIVFDRLARQQDPNAPASQAGVMPHVQMPQQGGGPASPTEAKKETLARAEEFGGHVGSMIRESMLGMLSIAGIGIGVGAAVRDVGQWYGGAQRLGGEMLRGTLMSGGGVGMYHHLDEGFRAEPRTALEAMTAPEDRARIFNALVESGMPARAAESNAALMGSVGLLAGGRPDAAVSAAGAGYGAYRSDRVPELLGTLVMIARDQGHSTSEMLRQFVGIRGVMESRQGQFTRSDTQMAELAGFQGMISGLPRGVGEGQGGVQIAERLASFGAPGTGGIQETIGMRAYIEATGKNPFGSPRERVQYIQWAQSPKGMAARAIEAKKLFGPDVAALILSDGGRRAIEPMLGLMEGDLSVDRLAGLIDREQLMDPEKGPGRGGMSRGMDELLETLGGQTLVNEATRQRNTSEEDKLVTALAWLERLKAQYPGQAALLEAVIGLLPFAFYFGGPPMLKAIVGMLRKMLGVGAVAGVAGGLPAAAAGGGAAAAAGGAGILAGAARGARGVARVAKRGVPWALPLMGAAEAGKDIYDIWSGSDPTNYVDLAAGATGAMVGGATGFLLGGPFGVLPGMATGYGLGKDVERLGEAGLDAAGIDLNSSARVPGMTGLNPAFAGRLNQMFAAAQAQGHKITVGSGFRTRGRQQMLWDRALRKYGSAARARKWVAPPGHSRHEHGIAADLEFGSAGARQWAHKHVGEFGMRFRMGHEPWHVEPTEGRMLAGRSGRGGAGGGTAGGTALAATDTGGDLITGSAAGGAIGQVLGEVHVFIHMDPSFPGRVATQGTPGVVVRRAS